ncbi:cytochrome C oxidase subunit II [Variovorax sp. EBFNA2]|uniref:cytochrome C oxidase subunit II n=1 Tax=Variovorax sp. EBFNA2 TaxID=3342097 RepID=UPI0029C014D4|nr:cytochrome C oxidase subunit II [Variovorax boronicumulans]WPG40966.1 cytochrome C oxidase subunit II [Variovorax boronicumulans]
MSAAAPPEGASEATAAAAERRWAFIVAGIIALLLAMMVFTGLHWAAMPPSRVETIDVNTVHLEGEFVESNLGTALGPDGKVTVRLIAQQYSFSPQCIVVPAEMPVTFRGTATDAIHGFIVGKTNANTMLIPGFVATFTTRFSKTGEQLMPCHEYCGTGHEAMWARVQVLPPAEFLEKARDGERLTCVSR